MTEIFSSLPSCPASCRDLLPDVSAIYFLMRGNECVYVGKSASLRHRWVSHEKLEEFENLDGLWIAWKPVAVSELDREETELINEMRPVLNYQMPSTLGLERYRIGPGLEWRLSDKLREANITLYGLARESGVSYVTLRQLTQPTPKRSISLSVLARICDTLSCSAGDLLHFERRRTLRDDRPTKPD
ncbi:MAG: helix-turn-helix domain-containing protein [Acidobacteria bacterium]|nr:helix-turn-helix domain-containing protein [Acidobacteriota bacterium]